MLGPGGAAATPDEKTMPANRMIPVANARGGHRRHPVAAGRGFMTTAAMASVA
jgi:hypothetical protein